MKTTITIGLILFSTSTFAMSGKLPGSSVHKGQGSLKVLRNFSAQVGGQTVSYQAGQSISGEIRIVKGGGDNASLVANGQRILDLPGALVAGSFLGYGRPPIGSGLVLSNDFEESTTGGTPTKETRSVSCTLTEKTRLCGSDGKCQEGTIERQGIRTLEVSDDNKTTYTDQKLSILNSKGQIVAKIDMGTDVEFSRSSEREIVPCH